jgi:2-polyprenyl-3-methyl-5-hydroxy-6-metoxy-1,4-benzoquinol methylase
MIHRVESLEWTNELVGKFWAYYGRNRSEDYFTNLFGDRLIDVTAQYYPAHARVLDYGCGSGFLLEKLLARFQTTGYDWATGNIDTVASRIGSHPNLIGLYAGEKGERPAGQFDVIYLIETLEHILEPQLESTLSELRSLLTDSGRIIVTTPNNEDLQAETVFCPCCEQTFHRWQHVRSLSQQGIAELMGKHGFADYKVFTTDFSARTAWQRAKARIRPWLGRKNPHLIYIGRKN